MSKEKRFAYNHIKLMGIRINGIIFGGMVRDEIVATYYKSLFDEHCASTSKKNYKKFWITSYHLETIKRTIIPNDMDIYFQNTEAAETFITSLESYATLYNGGITIINSPLYEFGENLIHKKIYINLYVGRTMIYPGIKMRLNIDVIINNTQTIIEPPFNNGDFTCNLFVMSKTGDNNYEIRLSKNTGTKLDSMSFIRKSNLQVKIMNDLISNSTEFIRTSIRDDSEYINGVRILKMIEKNMKISNLPFRELDTTDSTETCDICQMNIQSQEVPGQKFIEISTNKHAINIMHKSCFYRYLKNEIYKKYRNTETNVIECRCTRRNLFNFNECYKTSYVN